MSKNKEFIEIKPEEIVFSSSEKMGSTFLWIEEDVASRQEKLTRALNRSLEDNPKALVKIIQNSMGEELSNFIKSKGGKVFEAKSLKLNLMSELSFDWDVEFGSANRTEEYLSLMDRLELPLRFQSSPAAVYTFTTRHPGYSKLSPEDTQIIEQIKNNITPSYNSIQLISEIINYYVSQAPDAPNFNYSESLERYFQNKKGNHLADYLWLLLGEEDEESYSLLNPILNHPDRDIFFHNENPDLSGHNILITNHPDPLVNDLLAGVFLIRAMGEFSQNLNSNVLVIEEKYTYQNMYLWRAFTELNRIAMMKDIDVIATSSFVPRYLAFKQGTRSFVTADILNAWNDGLILGRISKNVDVLCRSPYPEIPLADAKRVEGDFKGNLMFTFNKKDD